MAAPTVVAPVRFGRRDRLVLAVLLTASFTLAVDFSVLNVALPAIARDVGLPLAHLQWVVTAFALCAAGFTLLFGRLADVVGRRRLFLAGIALLGLSSLAGGLAHAPAPLLVARVGQGLATAMVVPAALALLTTSFADARLRERAIGLNGSLMAAGFTTGAILGGVLTDGLNWRWAFFINVVVAAGVLGTAPAVLRDARPERRPRLDAAGAISATGALLALVYGLSRAGERSFGDGLVLGALALGLAGLVMFWAIEQRVEEPLVPVAVARRRTVAWGNVTGMLAFATETSLVFLLTVYLQKVLGYSALDAGLAFGVLGIGTVLGGLLGPRVIAAAGARTAIVGAMAVQAVATLPLAFLGSHGGSIALVLCATFVGGVANLVAIVGFMVVATAGMPDHEQGLATGLATTSQQVGITLGIPVMSAIATARLSHLGAATPGHVLSAVSLAIGINAAVALATAVVAWRGLPPQACSGAPR